MRTALYTNIVLTVACLLLVTIILQNLNIIHPVQETNVYNTNSSFSIDGTVTVKGEVSVEGEVSVDHISDPVEIARY